MRKTAPFWSYVDIRPSNVDKKSRAGETDVRLVNYTDVYYNQEITPALELMPATASEEHIQRYGVAPGDIIITKDSESPDDIGIPALVTGSEPDMVCAYHLSLLRPYAHLANPRFLYWVLESDEAKQHWLTNSYGVTRYSILTGAISRLRVPALDLSAQRRVADYLDHETGQIDAMMAKLEGLAEQLRNRRTASIDFALKTCTFTTLDHRWVVTDCLHKTADFIETGENYVVSIGQLDDEYVDVSSALRTTKDFFEAMREGGRAPVFGDAIMSRNASVGKIALVAENTPPFSMGQDVVLLHPRGQDNARLLAYVMASTQNQEALKLSMLGSTFKRINVASIKKLPWPHLDHAEQKRIADHLDEVTGMIDNMLAKVGQLKRLLSERRDTVVTEIVTGGRLLT